MRISPPLGLLPEARAGHAMHSGVATTAEYVHWILSAVQLAGQIQIDDSFC